MMTPIMRGWLMAVLLTAACGSDGPAGDPDGGNTPDAGVDPSQVFFDPARVIEVDIELAEADWDTLRRQTRSFLDILYPPQCMAGPFASPFTYFPGTATIDGHVVEMAGIRKKGFIGSLSEDKPSLKISVDEYVPDRDLLGVETFTFNNARQDSSYVRQCVTYQLFSDAGLAAPRCSFAHVTVNGRDLGLYVHVESMNKQFLARHYDDNDGNLYEGTLSDFRDGWLATFEKKTNEATNDGSELLAIATALEASDASLTAELEGANIDLDHFLTFWAMEVLTKHWDGYASNTNNYYLYRDPTSGRFQFLPWGVDGALMPNPLIGEQPPSSVFATGVLARRLYLHPETRDRYVARLEELLAGVWNEQAILDEIDRMEALITPIADPQGADDLDALIEEVRIAVRERRPDIEGELAGGPPAWDEPLRAPPCLDLLGTLDATFTTTWGTMGAPNPFATGTGTVTATYLGNPVNVTQVGATAGRDPNNPADPRAQVNLLAQLDDGNFVVVFTQIDPARFAPGQAISVDWTAIFGGAIHYNATTGASVVLALFGKGTVTLDQAAMTDGAPVTGALDLDLVSWPFGP